MLHKNGSIWKNKKTGKLVIMDYEPGVLSGSVPDTDCARFKYQESGRQTSMHNEEFLQKFVQADS